MCFAISYLRFKPTGIRHLARENDIPARNECLDVIEPELFEQGLLTHWQTPLAQVYPAEKSNVSLHSRSDQSRTRIRSATPNAFAHHGRHGDQDGQAEQAGYRKRASTATDRQDLLLLRCGFLSRCPASFHHLRELPSPSGCKAALLFALLARTCARSSRLRIAKQ